MGTSANSCPQCGTPLPASAPEGLCPRCVMAMNMATQTDFTGEEGPHGTKIFKQAPSPEELAGKFPQLEIIELLGRGGMGAVYKARQKELDRIVALKILPPGIGETPGFAERFTREAKALAKLNHPNIVTLYEFGRTDGLFFFLMEYVDGVNLSQLLGSGRVAPREALAIVPQICDALQYAHDQGIVHRDIKPDNILMDRRGRVKVADFGLAKIVSEAAGSGSAEETEAGTSGARPPARELTEAGKVMGTPQYMAPEQADHPTEVDHRADIYALGVVFYQMLTGELPGKRIEAPSTKVRIDVRLDEIVLRALEKNPERRYDKASVLKTDVETIAGTPESQEGMTTQAVPGHGMDAPILRWRDRWLWERNVIAFGFVPIAASLPFLRSYLGEIATVLLPVAGCVLGLTGLYSWLGHRIRQLKLTLPHSNAEVAEGWLAWPQGMWPFNRSQGLVLLHRDRLELIPAWYGGKITVPLEEIVSAHETRWVYVPLFWKRGFVLQLANGERVSLAIPEPIAQRWQSRLSPRGFREAKLTERSLSQNRWVRVGCAVVIALLAMVLVYSLVRAPVTSVTKVGPVGPVGRVRPVTPFSSSVDHSWRDQIIAMNTMDWREALNVADRAAKLLPAEGLAVVRENWTVVTNAESRKQFLKAFTFANHPHLVPVLELGFLDPAPSVQAWAHSYIEGVALRDFAEDYAAGKAWLAERRDRMLPDVLAESAQTAAKILRGTDSTAVLKQLAVIRGSTRFRDQPQAVQGSGLEEGFEALINGGDERVAQEALRAAQDLALSEEWCRRVVLPKIGSGNPLELRSNAASLLQARGGEWAVEPLLAALTNLLTATTSNERLLFSQFAGALGTLGSPKVIPTMIGVIEAQGAYDTIYGVGYFGLSKLTGVKYDASHDGAWWRQWWEKNKQRFPADVQALDVPRFAPVKNTGKPGAANDSRPSEIPAMECFAEGDTNKLYYLIGATNAASAPEDGFRLLLVLPGGDGGRDFQPFVKSIHAKALPPGFLTVQLVAPRWDAKQFEQVVWPTKVNRYPGMQFSTEEFVDAAIKDIEKQHRLAKGHVYTLSWSSGGPAAYAISLQPQTRVTGSFVAMSVFKPEQLPPLTSAKGHAYYILHSPKDFIPLEMAENARDILKTNGAITYLQTYEGGHGWHGNVFGNIRKGVEWLERR